MTNHYLIETKNMSKKFGKEVTLNHVSVHVRENSVYGLLGPNGAGKSTLLKMLTGFLKPTEGEIFFSGRPWKQEHLKSIGSLIEGPAIYENLTAFENLEVLTLLLDLPKARIHEVLQVVGLTKTGKKTVLFYS